MSKLLFLTSQDKILGGGICGSKARVSVSNTIVRKEQRQQQLEQILNEKEQLKKKFQIQSSEQKLYDEMEDFQKFNESYDQYFTTKKVSLKVIENDVRRIIENTLYDYREEIVQQEIRHKVIDMINLLINYFLIIRQNEQKSSIQSDINQLNDKLEILSTYCKENRERFPCLDLYQYIQILITLNSQRIGLDVANQGVASKIIQKIVQVAKFGAGFVSIAGAIKNLTEIDLKEIKNFVNEIKQIVQQITSDSSIDAIKGGFDAYQNYNTKNIANNMQALWLKKIQYLGDNLSENEPVLEIIFYLEELENVTNNDTQLFIYMQLNYLLQKEQMRDNYEKLYKKLEELKKQDLIIKQANILQVKEYSDSIIDKIKNIANLIAQSNQFRYIKAQILLHFAQILLLSNQSDFNDMMTSIVSNYLQEKQKQVKIIYEGNQVMANFIHNHLDKSQVLNQINLFKKQMTKHLDDKQQYNDFAFDILNEKDLDKQLAKYYVEMWELGVKQRQKRLQITHKDDVLLEAIHLYVNQQITYEDGYEINTEEKDAVKQIINQFLIPNFVPSQDDIQNEQQENAEKPIEFPCKIISILAEGGSGKSMLLKKLEVELLQRKSEYTKDKKSEYIPFIIKCNSLDREKPSIEDYLESANLKKKDIEILKKSERNKLIMLDGFDEYTGDYFKVYEKLKVNDWVNTVVIVTSRLEKIAVSDALIYFSYYDQEGNQGQSNTFAVFKLEKITESDIQEYLQKFKEQIQQKNQKDFNAQQYDKLNQIITKNRQLTELLKLPINLYLITRMITDMNLNDEKTTNSLQVASDQVEIQEIFFQYQFRKQSEIFIDQQKELQHLEEKQKHELIEKVHACYFEYFQSIAMQMFVQKSYKSNYLAITRNSIKFQLREQIQEYFLEKKINIDDLLQYLSSYVDSRVITSIRLTFYQENSQNQPQEIASQIEDVSKLDDSQEFEFRHKSLFEYFAARAMKYDFDMHKEDIYKLDISQLKQFNINKRIIMSSQRNASEQQILVKLYKLMKPYIDQQYFKQTYAEEDISKTNRYIQFIKKSTISKFTEISQIDIGASNLLSALFLSKFSYPNLMIKKCSLSQAYIPSHSRKVVHFQDCNLDDSFIEKQNFEFYETSNTKNVQFLALSKMSITETGFVNQFEVIQNKTSQHCKMLKSNQISNAPLKSIHFIYTKNIFVVRANSSLFEIDASTFEKINSFTFPFAITSLSINSSKYLVNLANKQIFYGEIQNGFKLLDQSKIQSEQCLSLNDFIVTYHNESIIIYSLENLQIIKTIEDLPCDLNVSSFSPDCKYLVISTKENSCQIYDVQKQYEFIDKIQDHSDSITSIAFSADSKYLVTGSNDQTCKIWNAEKKFEFITKIQGHTESINSIAFSEDCKYLSTASFTNQDKNSENGICQIWDVDKGFVLLSKIQQDTIGIRDVAFSANDGKYLATASYDSICHIWDIQKGLLINTLDSVISVAFSGDSKYLVTGYDEKIFNIWNVQKQFELIKSIQGHTSSVLSVAFSGNSKFLATGSQDYTCKIWNAQKGFELVNTIQAYSSPVEQVIFSVDNQYLAIRSQNSTCNIWSVNKGFELLNVIKLGNISIQSIAISPDSKYLAIGLFDSSFQIQSLQNNPVVIKEIYGHNKSICSVAFSPDGQYFATSSSDKTCKVWNILKGFELIDTIKGHSKQINIITFSSDSQYLATGSDDKTCKIWNIKKGFESINQLNTHSKRIYSVDFSSDSKYLVTCSEDKTCKIWEVNKEFELVYEIKSGDNIFFSANFSADVKYLAIGTWNGTCQIWSLQNGYELKYTLEGHQDGIESVAFSPDGNYLATGSDDTTCKIWSVKKAFQLQHTIQEHGQPVLSVAFSIDSKYLASGSWDSTCNIWNLNKNFENIKKIEEHQQAIYQVAFSPNGNYFVTGSMDTTCKIWNVNKQFELISTIQSNDEQIQSIAFSFDSKYLAIGTDGHICQIWNMDKDTKLIATLKGHTQTVKSLAFSKDGKYLATGSFDSKCKIWNIQKGLKQLTNSSPGENKTDGKQIVSDGSGNVFEQEYEL